MHCEGINTLQYILFSTVGTTLKSTRKLLKTGISTALSHAPKSEWISKTQITQVAPTQPVWPYFRISSPVLFILQHTFTVIIHCSFKEQWICLAFTTVTTAHIDSLVEFKMQSLDTADNAATARKSQPRASK